MRISSWNRLSCAWSSPHPSAALLCYSKLWHSPKCISWGTHSGLSSMCNVKIQILQGGPSMHASARCTRSTSWSRFSRGGRGPPCSPYIRKFEPFSSRQQIRSSAVKLTYQLYWCLSWSWRHRTHQSTRKATTLAWQGGLSIQLS